jgi:hypothetical protein
MIKEKDLRLDYLSVSIERLPYAKKKPSDMGKYQWVGIEESMDAFSMLSESFRALGEYQPCNGLSGCKHLGALTIYVLPLFINSRITK